MGTDRQLEERKNENTTHLSEDERDDSWRRFDVERSCDPMKDK